MEQILQNDSVRKCGRQYGENHFDHQWKILCCRPCH